MTYRSQTIQKSAKEGCSRWLGNLWRYPIFSSRCNIRTAIRWCSVRSSECHGRLGSCGRCEWYCWCMVNTREKSLTWTWRWICHYRRHLDWWPSRCCHGGWPCQDNSRWNWSSQLQGAHWCGDRTRLTPMQRNFSFRCAGQELHLLWPLSLGARVSSLHKL